MKCLKKLFRLQTLINLSMTVVIIVCIYIITTHYYNNFENKQEAQNLASRVNELRQHAKPHTLVPSLEPSPSIEPTSKPAPGKPVFIAPGDPANANQYYLDMIDKMASNIEVRNVAPNDTKLYMLRYYELLHMENPDMIGWIRIPDTAIDYPVMQTNNNEFYLHRGFDKKRNHEHGSIFADYRASILPPSDNIILYGHNMKDGSMFGELSNYRDEEFYKEHPIVLFDTLYDEQVYDIVSVFYSKAFKVTDEAFRYYEFMDAKNEKEFNRYIKNIKKLQRYETGITPVYGDKLITLSTCDKYTEDGRFVVIAKLRK